MTPVTTESATKPESRSLDSIATHNKYLVHRHEEETPEFGLKVLPLRAQQYPMYSSPAVAIKAHKSVQEESPKPSNVFNAPYPAADEKIGQELDTLPLTASDIDVRKAVPAEYPRYTGDYYLPELSTDLEGGFSPTIEEYLYKPLQLLRMARPFINKHLSGFEYEPDTASTSSTKAPNHEERHTKINYIKYSSENPYSFQRSLSSSAPVYNNDDISKFFDSPTTQSPLFAPTDNRYLDDSEEPSALPQFNIPPKSLQIDFPSELSYNEEYSEIGNPTFIVPENYKMNLPLLSSASSLPVKTHGLTIDDGQFSRKEIRKDNGEFISRYVTYT